MGLKSSQQTSSCRTTTTSDGERGTDEQDQREPRDHSDSENTERTTDSALFLTHPYRPILIRTPKLTRYSSLIVTLCTMQSKGAVQQKDRTSLLLLIS